MVYIGGSGRNGSTLTDRLLGSLDGFFSTGELRFLVGRGWGQGRLCGCGEPIPTCPVWSVVRERLGQPDPVLLSVAAKRVLRNRNLPVLLGWRDAGDDLARALATYRTFHADLFGAIREVTGAAAIVDSSSEPLVALALAGADGVDVELLHLVRDARAVAHSWSRMREQSDRQGSPPRLMPRYSAAKAASDWARANVLLEAASSRTQHATRVRYEDLIAQPAMTVERVLDALELPAVDVSTLSAPVLDLPVAHTVSGNPDRFAAGPVRLAVDDRWREEMPRRARLAALTIGAPLLARYGYLTRSGSPVPNARSE